MKGQKKDQRSDQRTAVLPLALKLGLLAGLVFKKPPGFWNFAERDSSSKENGEGETFDHLLQCKIPLTSHRRRSMAGSWLRTHRTHPQEAAAQTGCQ